MKLYGIKDCDTVRKARAWFDERGIDRPFHDFKTDGITPTHIDRWEKAAGWETLLNRKGMTWRALPDNATNQTRAGKCIGAQRRYFRSR